MSKVAGKSNQYPQHQRYILTIGSHLLQELTVPSFVANDTFVIGGLGNLESLSEAPSEMQESVSGSEDRVDGPSMLLLTGPNYSGKSVYLKQVGVLGRQLSNEN